MPCMRRWTESADAAVSFQAVVALRGRIAARSPVVTVRWKTPPPAAAVGHYCGFTDEGKSICFDATTTSVSNFDTTSDITCGSLGTIPDLRLQFGGSAPIQSDLSFTFSFNGPVDAGGRMA